MCGCCHNRIAVYLPRVVKANKLEQTQIERVMLMCSFISSLCRATHRIQYQAWIHVISNAKCGRKVQKTFSSHELCLSIFREKENNGYCFNHLFGLLWILPLIPYFWNLRILHAARFLLFPPQTCYEIEMYATIGITHEINNLNLEFEYPTFDRWILHIKLLKLCNIKAITFH